VTRTLALGGLVALAAILALVLVAEIGFDWGDAADAAVPPVERHAAVLAATTVRAPTPAPQRPLELAAAILARPLFAPDRKPPVGHKVATPTVAQAQADGMPRLTGIIIDDDTRLAIFQPKGTDKPIVVGEGDVILGRRVALIDPLEVVVEGIAGNEHLHPVPDPTLATAAPLETPEAPPLMPPGRMVNHRLPGDRRPGFQRRGNEPFPRRIPGRRPPMPGQEFPQRQIGPGN
jgi:hypothetical protein